MSRTFDDEEAAVLQKLLDAICEYAHRPTPMNWMTVWEMMRRVQNYLR